MLVGSYAPSQIEVFNYDSGGGTWRTLASDYDRETGNKNLAYMYECPLFGYENYILWKNENGHDRFVVYKNCKEFGIKTKV